MTIEPDPCFWHVANAGVHFGPLSVDDVKRLIYTEVVGGEALGWRAEMPDWLPLKAISEFSALFVEEEPGIPPSFESLAPLAHSARPPLWEEAPQDGAFAPKDFREPGPWKPWAARLTSRFHFGKPWLRVSVVGVASLAVGILAFRFRGGSERPGGFSGVSQPSSSGESGQIGLIRLTTDVAGSLPKAAVEGVVGKKGPGLESGCWSNAKQSRDKAASGLALVSVEITIGIAGVVEKAHAEDPKGYHNLAACVVHQIEGWQFPTSSTGATRARVGVTFATR